MTDHSQKNYGVLIHGAGWVAGQHAAAFQNHPAAEVVAVSSRKISSAERLVHEAGLIGAETFDKLDAALACEGVDIVCVCTPQHLHCENVLAAAATGKHIVIEKPVAISLDELRRMHEAVDRAGVKTVVSFVLRWNPLFQEIKNHLATTQQAGRSRFVLSSGCAVPPDTSTENLKGLISVATGIGRATDTGPPTMGI